jgi:hypothetical protein
MDLSDLLRPPPALPRGPLPRTPGFRCWRTTDTRARQAGVPLPSTHLCIRFAGKAPWGGLRTRRVPFFLYLYVLFMNGLHSGQRGAPNPPSFPPTPGFGMSRITSSAPGPRPQLGSTYREPRTTPPEDSPSPEVPPPLGCQLLPVYAKASAATPPQGPAPLAAAFVTLLTACSPTPSPNPSRGCPLPFLLVSPMPTIEQ